MLGKNSSFGISIFIKFRNFQSLLFSNFAKNIETNTCDHAALRSDFYEILNSFTGHLRAVKL